MQPRDEGLPRGKSRPQQTRSQSAASCEVCPGHSTEQRLCGPSPGPSVLGTDCGFTRSSKAFLAAGELSHEATSAHSSSHHHERSPSPRRPHSSAALWLSAPGPCTRSASAQIPGPGTRHGRPSFPLYPQAVCSLSQVAAATAAPLPSSKCQRPHMSSLAQTSPKLGCVCP